MKRVVTMILLLAVLSGLLGGCGLGENPDFRFKLNKDRKSYTLVEYVGDDEDVEIPYHIDYRMYHTRMVDLKKFK